MNTDKVVLQVIVKETLGISIHLPKEKEDEFYDMFHGEDYTHPPLSGYWGEGIMTSPDNSPFEEYLKDNGGEILETQSTYYGRFHDIEKIIQTPTKFQLENQILVTKEKLGFYNTLYLNMMENFKNKFKGSGRWSESKELQEFKNSNQYTEITSKVKKFEEELKSLEWDLKVYYPTNENLTKENK